MGRGTNHIERRKGPIYDYHGRLAPTKRFSGQVQALESDILAHSSPNLFVFCGFSAIL
jgi:hypothetical protein